MTIIPADSGGDYCLESRAAVVIKDRRIGRNSLIAFLFLALTATAQSGLNARQFKKYWQVESESPNYRLTFVGDTCEVLAPKGLTLWRRQQLKADCAVEYDVQVTDEGREGDRLSDMNVF